MERIQQIERSIITSYRKRLWSKFLDAVNKYELINDDDKIAVCISGGKDSFLMAKLIQEYLRHGGTKAQARYIVMDPGYNEKNIQLIKSNAEEMGVPIEIFTSDVFEVSNMLNAEKPCYLCAKMRRGFLYSVAEEIGCNKIALGHHFNDVIETLLINMFYAAEIKSMMPKLKSTAHNGMELIRPLYMIKERDIINWCQYNSLKFINCACSFTERISSGEVDSKRSEVKKLVDSLCETYEEIDDNIFRSLHNVNIDGVIRYKKNGKEYSFLDDYE